MSLPVSKEEAKRLLREMLGDPELRSIIEEELASTFAPKQATEDHLQKLYQEVVRLREESERKWQEYQRRWEEMLADLRKLREESEKRWQEYQQKWQETTAELRRLREESERKWAEYQRRWEEMMADLRRLREESEKRWQETTAELRRLREESEKRWEETQKHLEQLYHKVQELDRLYRNSITAIGARWGYQTEGTFRNTLKAFLEEDFGVKVERYLTVDAEGKVFGRPATVELDLVIYNNKTILAEIKSSVSEADVHAFLNKVAFYEEKEGRKASRLMIISPMVHPEAQKLAEAHQVEVHTYPTKENFP